MEERINDNLNGRVTRQRMQLADLKPHPLQSVIYTPCSKAEDDALADDLRRSGQREPVPILPAGNKAGLPANTILDGHRRKQQMLALGLTEVNVVVRDDLKDADEKTVTEEFLKYNFIRRQLHPLDRARVVQQIFLAKHNVSLERLDCWKKTELRELVGKALNMGGRNCDRYLRVLECPIEIQTAVRDGRLPLVLGSQVSLLPKERRAELAAKVAALPPEAKVNDFVKEYVDAPGVRNRRRVSDDVRSLALHLENATLALSDRVDAVESGQARVCLSRFEEGLKLIQKLIRKASEVPGTETPDMMSTET